MQRVLVLCTGNSCRSIIAEALINALGTDRLSAVSAGSKPTGFVHPQAVATLKRNNIDPGTPLSQSWDVFADNRFDYVITVCDRAAGETCPLFSGPCQRLHWSIPDPAELDGDEKQQQAFDAVFQQLKQRIENELL